MKDSVLPGLSGPGFRSSFHSQSWRINNTTFRKVLDELLTTVPPTELSLAVTFSMMTS
jgi:hypothetical protein